MGRFTLCMCLDVSTVPLVFNFTNTHVQKATARNIDRNAPE